MQPQPSMVPPFELQGRTLAVPPGGRLENGQPVCVECMMRDEDMADVNVLDSSIWERESDAAFFDAIKQEHRYRAKHPDDPDLPRVLHADGRALTRIAVKKIAYGDSLTAENLAEHSKVARFSSAQKQRNTHAFVHSQRVLLGTEEPALDAPPKKTPSQSSPAQASQPSVRGSPARGSPAFPLQNTSPPSHVPTPPIGSPAAHPDSALAMAHDRVPGTPATPVTPATRAASPTDGLRAPRMAPTSSRSSAVREQPSVQNIACGLDDLMPPARPFAMGARGGSAAGSPTRSTLEGASDTSVVDMHVSDERRRRDDIPPPTRQPPPVPVADDPAPAPAVAAVPLSSALGAASSPVPSTPMATPGALPLSLASAGADEPLDAQTAQQPTAVDEMYSSSESESEHGDDPRRRRPFRGFFRKIVGARPPVGARDDNSTGLHESPASVRTASSSGLWQRLSRPRSVSGNLRRKADPDASADFAPNTPGRRRARTRDASAAPNTTLL